MPIPATGTFRVYPKSLTNSVPLFTPGAGGGPSAVYQIPNEREVSLDFKAGSPIGSCIATTVLQGGSYYSPQGRYDVDFSVNYREVIFNPGGGQILADLFGSTFPMGFLATTLRINFTGTVSSGLCTVSTALGVTRCALTFGGFTIIADETSFGVADANMPPISGATTIVGLGLYFGVIKAFNRIGFSTTFFNNSNPPGVSPPYNVCCIGTDFGALYLQGDYILWSTTLTTTTPVAFPGSKVIINEGSGKLLQITVLKAYFIDDANVGTDGTPEISEPVDIPDVNIITHTAFQLVFYLPIFTSINRFRAYGGKRILITGVGNGVEFTGEVNLILLNQLLVDGSGIYELQPGKTSDTYYDRTDPANVVTTDLKIPNPFGRTGFFGK